MTPASRSFLSVILVVLASVAMFASLLARQANVVLVSPAGFSDRAMTVVRSGAVEGLIVDNVTGRVVSLVGDRAGVRQEVDAAVREALANGRVAGDVRAASRSLQSELVTGNASTLTLMLPDLSSVVAASMQSASPQIAAVVGRVGTITVVNVGIPSGPAGVIHHLAAAAQDSWLLVILTVALALLALTVSPHRRRTLIGLGFGALASGLLVAAVYLAGRGVVADQFSSAETRAVAGAAWRVYLSGLEISGLAVAGAGALVAAIAILSRPRSQARNKYR